MSTVTICFHGVYRDNFTLTYYQKEKLDVKRNRIKPIGGPRYAGYCHLLCDTMQSGRSTNGYEEYAANRFLRKSGTLLHGIPSQQMDTWPAYA